MQIIEFLNLISTFRPGLLPMPHCHFMMLTESLFDNFLKDFNDFLNHFANLDDVSPSSNTTHFFSPWGITNIKNIWVLKSSILHSLVYSDVFCSIKFD